MTRLILTTLACALVLASSAAQEAGFSQDSAYADLNVLVNVIGPRPMGSPAEAKALRFAVGKFKEYGCQEAYVMPMTDAAGVNTASGIAVGVLKGKTRRIILIGGHMDSAGPEVPGANDDGSGAASVIELARVIGKKEHESTVVFCCWGGEEEGLRGSEYFVAHYPQLDSVALMLQIDMADGAGTLDADPDGAYQVSAPRWLVDATFGIFYDDLHYQGLVYPTQSATVNSSSSGQSGSDHMPFLAKGIPAIDFTSDVSYPIHTPLDSWSNFTPSGLPRSGNLVLKLFERFDGGVPSRTTEKYWMVVVGHRPVYFSHPVLRAAAVLAFLLGLVALLAVRRRQPAPGSVPVVRWSALKLFLFALIIQSFIWLSENVIGVIRGYRFPWVGNYGMFELLALFSGLIGLWLTLRLTRRLPLSANSFGYALRAFVLLCALIALLSWANAELAVYPALSLVALSLALLIRRPVLKGLFAVLAPLPMILLAFPEYLGLFQRILSQSRLPSIGWSVVYNLGFVLFYTLLALPFVYGIAAVYRVSERDLFWLKKFGRPAGLGLACCGALVTVIILLFRPVYDPLWERAVSVTQSCRVGADTCVMNISSAEYLSGVRCSWDGRDSTLTGRRTEASLRAGHPLAAGWLRIDTSVTSAGREEDSLRVFTRTVVLHPAFRPLQVTVAYRSDKPFSARSSWVTGNRGPARSDTMKSKTFTWYAFPDTPLVIPVTFALRDSQTVRESVEVTFDSLAYPLALSRDLTYFRKRTVIDAGSAFGAPREVAP